MNTDSSFSNSISMLSSYEEFGHPDETSGVPGRSREAISNERIRKGDFLLETYEVTGDAISGGMGSIWRVRHTGWNIDLAMKRPQPKFFAEAGQRRKDDFIRECENWVHIGMHRNIVTCYYVRDLGGVPTIFSEWAEGGSLADWIRDGRLYSGDEEEDLENILTFAAEALQGLTFAHSRGLLHQDIKPSNILIGREEGYVAKIADVGLARARSGLGGSTENTGTLGYTLSYCPAEQARKEEPEKWMDLYAWAVTVLEMFIGERAWHTGAEVKDRLDELFEKCRIDLPDGLDELLADCIRGRQNDTPAVMQRMIRIFEEATGWVWDAPPADLTESANTLNNRALSCLDIGRTDEAEAYWDKALAADPRHRDSIYNRTLLHYRQHKLQPDQVKDALISINLAADIEECYNRFVKDTGGNLLFPERSARIPQDLAGLHLRRDHPDGYLRISPGAEILTGISRSGGSWQCTAYQNVELKTLFCADDGSAGSGTKDRPVISTDERGETVAADVWTPAHDPSGSYHTHVYSTDDRKLIREFDRPHGILSGMWNMVAFEEDRTVTVMSAASGETVFSEPDCSLIGFHMSILLYYNHGTKEFTAQGLGPGGSSREAYMTEVCPEEAWRIDTRTWLLRDPYGFVLCDKYDKTCKRIFDDHPGFVCLFPAKDSNFLVLLYENGAPEEPTVDAAVLDISGKRIVRRFPDFMKGTAAFTAALVTGIKYPEYVQYLPGEPAEYQISHIETAEEIRLAQESFQELIDEAVSLIETGEFDKAMEALDYAEEEPLFRGSAEPARLRSIIGRPLTKKRLKRIVPFSAPLPFSAVNWEEAESRVEALYPAAESTSVRPSAKEVSEEEIRRQYPDLLSGLIGEYDPAQLRLILSGSGKRLLVCHGRSYAVTDLPAGTLSGRYGHRMHESITFCSFLEDENFCVLQDASGYFVVYDIRRDSTDSENFFGTLYGTVRLINDDCFAIERNNRSYPCRLEWEYDLENLPAMS